VFRVAQPIDIPLFVVNDAQESVRGLHLYAQLRAPDGEELAVVQHTLMLDADCLAQEMDRLRLTPTRPGDYTLEVKLTGGVRDIAHVYRIEVA
jgi:beta-mannosidase